MAERQPIQTSAVYLMGPRRTTYNPPPSPPSPADTPVGNAPGKVDNLSLDGAQELSDGQCSECSEQDVEYDERLDSAIHVLDTEAKALRHLTELYKRDRVAREGFGRAIDAITRHRGEKGKLVIVGVGKSGHIAKKLTATFNSLAVPAAYLHPTEALHGDLGNVGRDDTVLFITFSGRTPELATLMPHIDRALPVLVLTSHTTRATCELGRYRRDMILVPAPIHEAETVSFGVSAPTTSTTAALAVGDALAIVASRALHPSVVAVFRKNHPGGAIGQSFLRPKELKEVAVPWAEIPVLRAGPSSSASSSPSGAGTEGATAPPTGADVLRAAYSSDTGWVRVGDDTVASPSRIRRLSSADLSRPLCEMPWLLAECHELLPISAGVSRKVAVEWIKNIQLSKDNGDIECRPDAILAVWDMNELFGVAEVGQLLDGVD